MAVYRKAGGAWSLLPDSNAIYVKVAGAWTPIGAAKPTGPASLTGTAGNAQVALSWPAATVPWGTVTEYQVQATSYDWTTGVVGTQTVTGTSYTWTGLTNGTPYWFRVRAKSSEGVWGEWKQTTSTVTPASPWNVATGGTTVNDVPNYNGTGETWRVHTFSTPGGFAGAFSVSAAPQPFRILTVGGGGGGGALSSGRGGGGGGGGGVADVTVNLSAIAYDVVVGATGGLGANGGESYFATGSTKLASGGGGGTGHAGSTGSGTGRNGGTSGSPQSNIGGLNSSDSWSGGGGGGAGGPGGNAVASGAPGVGGPGLASTITGASVAYGGGAYGASQANAGSANAGVVIVAYRIA